MGEGLRGGGYARVGWWGGGMAAGERRGVQRSGGRGDDGFVRGIFCGWGVRSEGFLVFLGMGKKGVVVQGA